MRWKADWVADWKKWSSAERVLALLVTASLLCAVIGVGAALGAGSLFSGSAVSAFSGSAASADDPAGRCGYYINSHGNLVPRPCGTWRSDAPPPRDATAKCQDGTWSWSRHRY